MMQAWQTLRKIDESVMVVVPPDMLEEMGLEAGQDVQSISRENTVRVEPLVPQPSLDAVEFASRFTKKYEEAMRNLAGR